MSNDPTLSSTAFSLISKSWREVRDSADADIQLIRARASSFKNLATSFDRELENLETGLVNKLKPKITEFQRAYSLENWSQHQQPRRQPGIRVDMLAAEKDEGVEEGKDGILMFGKGKLGRGWRKLGFREGEMEEEEGVDYWEPIRALKKRFERRSFEFQRSEFVQKVKTSLKSICKEPQDSKEVPPLDFPELLACLVRQSEPFLDQLGVRRDFCDKIVESLCSKHKDQLLLRSLSEGDLNALKSDNINDDLDLRLASVLQSTGHRYDGGLWRDHQKCEPKDGKRHVAIVTTASLPWLTGTAVNPLFRAAYLAQSGNQNVTLVVPWLCRSDQQLVYPNNITFNSPQEQESYIRSWLEERTGSRTGFKISFYPGKFSKERRSIIPTGDTSQFIPSKNADIAILEEPEHLNWYHHGKRWTDKFNHVVGVVHTNYLEYIKREKYGAFQAFLVKHINNIVARAHCHKVLRLSAATQDLPKSVICNVHGVNPTFLKIGERVAAETEQGRQAFSKGAYFLGKMVWAKGYRELIDLLSKNKSDLEGFKLDVYGNGEDAHEVRRKAKSADLKVNFLKGRDHADDLFHGYKVFINPSVSDVLCTATAEALAMGKFVVCADHPSNEFFKSFPNCLTYKTSEDFVAKVKEALTNEPLPLTPEQRYNLSWEAATQRFIEYSELDSFLNSNAEGPKSSKTHQKINARSASMPNITDVVDGGLAFAHYCFTGNEFLRLCTGAIPRSRDYSKQHSEDLNLLHPRAENPIYGW